MAENEDDIARYHRNEMSGKERNAFEQKALNDPFLSDAIEGATSVSPEEFTKDVQELSWKIQPEKSSGRFTPFRIAASVAIVLTSTWLLYLVSRPEPALLALEKIDSTITSRPDSSSSLLTMAEPAAVKEEPKIFSSGAQALELKPETLDASSAGAGALSQQPQAQEAVPTQHEKAERAVAETELKEETETARVKSVEQLDVRKKTVIPQVTAAAPVPPAGPRTISGKVTEAEDGTPLPGANVILKGTSVSTVTDFEGNYSIPIAARNPQLSYSFDGLVAQEVSPGEKTTLNIQLKDDASQFSEVVVIPQTFNTDVRDDLATPGTKLATPVSGLRAFTDYLGRNQRYPREAAEKKISGKVTIEFTVTPASNLTGFRVVKALGFGCDEEVIRLVKEGPRWTPSVIGDIPIESKVRLKLEFDLEKANR